MPNTAQRPPIFVRWLSLSKRIKLAAWLRDKGADWGEWVCPEIAPPDLTDEKGADE